MDRRDFFGAAALTLAAGPVGAEGAGPTPGVADVPPPAANPGPPRTRRWMDQRWLVDNVIQANGIDWDQGRTAYLNAPCGTEATADFAAIRARVKKYADIGAAFVATAQRREARARAAEAAGESVTARDNYYMAAIHWAAAQWPLDENDHDNVERNTRKRESFGRYAALADHRVEEAWITLGSQRLPAWFHLPPGYSGGRLPVVVAIPGMDSFKEALVSLYGDRWLQRGCAVLAVDGPGQYESAVLGVRVSMPAWAATGPAIFDWVAARPEVDAARVGMVGTSFGSLATTVAVGNEPRYKALAVSATALEPGFDTVFEGASPTFKQRFMYMAGYDDEAAFDRFRRTLTWEGSAERLRLPFLCLAGEADELCPMEFTERMLAAVPGPKQLVVYQDSRHSVGGVPATNNGPVPATLQADWMVARLAGRPFASERWFVEGSGRVVRTPFG